MKSPTKECHIKCKKKSDHHSGVLGKLFDGLNGNFIHAESRICIKEHFFSLGKPFLRWFWPFSLLAWSRKCSEFDRASNNFNLLVHSLVELHWFRRYWYFETMRGLLDYLYVGQHIRTNLRITMICSTRSTRYTFWSFLIVQNGWNLLWLSLNSILRAKRFPFLIFKFISDLLTSKRPQSQNFKGKFCVWGLENLENDLLYEKFAIR